MTPLEASSLFATLVGLICNWRDERGREPTDKFQDFITWLTNHNFLALKERIYESDELQQQLNLLLRQDFDVLSTKLDTISSAISAISDKIDSFTQVGLALRTAKESVSVQAIAILKVFDHLEAHRMVVFIDPPSLRFLPGKQPINVGEPRFLDADVAALAAYGLIELVDQTGSGSPIFSLTRAGAQVALSVSEDYLPKDARKDEPIK